MAKKKKLRGRPPKKKLTVINIPGKRRPWTSTEDEVIKSLVQENGTQQWALIADKLNKKIKSPIRSGKQCRERWHNHLDPTILKDPWSLDEEKLLFEKHIELGNKWADISRFLQGRTDNSIKNHFYSMLRRQYRKLNGFDANRQQLKEYDEILSIAILNTVNKKIKSKKHVVAYNEKDQSQTELSDYDLRPLDDLIVTGVGINFPDHNPYLLTEEVFMMHYDLV
ncbi:hypothetical protein SteCoe_18048 [Stentor coeruleus]|uniref:Myb-like DNA-binding domain containing protein n=1 Tax=Stentor coeruleus TaxID=5963 RepID=A0A1R2BXP3_9CILI|nr:hypothetical protein SteCoe_18048 [Stentor coeruleus]